MSQNDDLADFMDNDDSDNGTQVQKPPLAGNRNKQMPKKNSSGANSLLVNAGMNASRKALFDNNSNEAQSTIQQ